MDGMDTDTTKEIRYVLASGSPRRKELLEKMGLSFQIIKSQVEETITESDPSLVVEELSRQKAEDVAQRLPEDTVVIGADTIVVLNGNILGKPDGETGAYSMLKELSGKTHEVYTGVTLCRGRKRKSFSVCTQVVFDTLSEEEIRSYIATGECLDKAGAYGIQGSGAMLVREIHGDYYNVVGLPVNRVYRELQAFI